MRDDQQGGPPQTGFFVAGTVSRDPYSRDDFTAITVRESNRYWDIVCWADNQRLLDGFRALRSGDEVHIEGTLSKRKVKNTDRWEISLVAQKMRPVGRPAREQYEPPRDQNRAAQAREWNQQQNNNQNARDAAGQQGRQYGGQHPDAADWNDQGGPSWGQR